MTEEEVPRVWTTVEEMKTHITRECNVLYLTQIPTEPTTETRSIN